MGNSPCIVVKVGGSLYSLPDLKVRLHDWLAAMTDAKVLLVPGGDGVADVVRSWDRTHGLGEEAAHWLALRSLSLTAHFLAALLPGIPIVATWNQESLAILDGFAFAQVDERREGRLPHRWEASSDALAARAAVIHQADRLILLKSIDVEPGLSWEEAALRGSVDRCFPGVVASCPESLEVLLINFRSWRPGP